VVVQLLDRPLLPAFGQRAREDAAGIERVIAGIAASNPDDAARLERGYQLFDDLYALLSR